MGGKGDRIQHQKYSLADGGIDNKIGFGLAVVGEREARIVLRPSKGRPGATSNNGI